MAGEIVKYQQEGVQAKYKEILQIIRRSGSSSSYSVSRLWPSAVITVVITRSITSPIRRNIDIARTLAEGNLSVEIVLDRKDEFGDEMRAFRDMVEKWKVLIGSSEGFRGECRLRKP